jgi:hypothetical protein
MPGRFDSNNDFPHSSHQSSSNQIKSNQIKSNQIKSNEMEIIGANHPSQSQNATDRKP